MTLHGALLNLGDIDSAFATHWDALPTSRGDQADIYDSWAWHAAWLHGDEGLARSLRIPAVLSDDRPVALLPLAVTRSRSWRSAGSDSRPRSRVILRGEADPTVYEMLADVLVRDAPALALHRLPSRDPATAAMIDALRTAGYRVSTSERSADRLAPIEDGWDGHRRRFKGFARYAKRASGRAGKMWDLGMDTYGVSPDAPIGIGFRIYADLHARSWKGPMDQVTCLRREALLLRAEALGWARVFVLRIDDTPVAAHVWFRLGDAAIWMSTAHDRSLDALSPGTIVQWWAQERIFDDPVLGPPRIVDLLPGGSDQKDRLSPLRPPLIEIDAVRNRVFAGASLRMRSQARRIGPGVEKRIKARVRALREKGDRDVHGRRTPIRRVVIEPGVRRRHPIQRFGTEDPSTRRFLAAAVGASSPEAMITGWEGTDTWWSVGTPTIALVRLGASPDRTAREVIRFDPVLNLEEACGALADALAESVTIAVADAAGRSSGETVIVHDPWLPMPRFLHERDEQVPDESAIEHAAPSGVVAGDA
jgi:GNAT acetyltransferase-like protein